MPPLNTPFFSRLILLFALFPTLLTAQQEAFERYEVSLRVDTLGTIGATERISVTAAGDQIKRGIIRGLSYRATGKETGDRGNANIKVTAARRGGEDEKYRVRNSKGYTTIRLGKKSVKLDPGRYDYEIEYTSINNVYFLPQAEELRLPLFSSDTELPIQAASATLTFPEGAALIRGVCFVGGEGSEDQSRCNVTLKDNTLTYEVTESLPAGTGITIGAVFAPGTFTPPPSTAFSPTALAPAPPPTLLEQKGTLWAALLGILGMFFYGYTTWQRYGVDPPTPDVGRQYYPPEELSPAAVVYHPGVTVGHTGLTAALTALAAKGYLRIEETEKKSWLGNTAYFTITPTDRGAGDDLPPEEALLLERFRSIGIMELKGEPNKQLQELTKDFFKKVDETYKPIVHVPVNGWRVFTFFAIGCVGTLLALFYVRTATGPGIAAMAVAGLMTLFGTIAYYYLLQKPTPAQVNLKARKKAFHQYLKLKEKDRKALPNAPVMTQEYFSTVLPYAVAFGISNDWADTLAGDLAATLQDNNGVNTALHLTPLMTSNFSRRINTAYSATSQASGGGFSGGGGGVSGGGGGSGGW